MIPDMDDAVFRALADPTRRSLLDELFKEDGQTLHAVAGDTATAPAGAWHGFKNCGTGRLRVLCIHASDRIIQEWQDAPGVLDIPSTGN